MEFVAQGLEHWSCKPGVESSNLSEGYFHCYPCIFPPVEYFSKISPELHFEALKVYN